jgi:hypothetical protein
MEIPLKMPLLDESNTRRLALIRYMYNLAVLQSLQPEPLSCISVLIFHDSVELFLQLVSEPAKKVKSHMSFMDYWDVLSKEEGGIELTQKVQMSRLNNARVAFKHYGTRPSNSDIESFRVYVTDFFNENTSLIFGVNFNAISLLDLIKCVKTKEALEEVQQFKDDDNLNLALNQISLAFAYLIDDYEERKQLWYGKSPFFFGKKLNSMSSSQLGFPIDSDISTFVDNVSESINQIQSATKIISLGIDYRRYTRFKLLTPDVSRQYNGTYYISSPSTNHKLKNEDIQYCYDFVIESSLHLQEFDFDVEKGAPPINLFDLFK